MLFELTKRYDEREIASMTLAAKAHGRNSKIVAGLEQQIGGKMISRETVPSSYCSLGN